MTDEVSSLNKRAQAPALLQVRISDQHLQASLESREVTDKTGGTAGQNAISFDLFVQSCISLKRMTEVFKGYDDDRDGYITLSL